MRAHPILAAGLIGLVVAACGSGTGSAGSGSSGGPADAGSSGNPADAGTASDAGTGADAGQGGGSGGGSGGGPDGGGGSGGGGGLDGGTASADCDGVVPASLGQSFSFTVPDEVFGQICISDTADESGNIASALENAQFQYPDRIWHTYDPAGGHLARLTAFQLFPQGPGFEGLFNADSVGPPPIRVGYWTPDGKRTDGPIVGGDEVAANGYRAWPNGLFVVSQRCQMLPGAFTLSRFDDRANRLASASLQGGCESSILGATVDANGDWLLVVHGRSGQVFPEEAIFAQWFDSSGKSLTGWFRVGPIAGTKHTSLVHALIGGGAALQFDGAWTDFLPSAKAEVQPAPEFLLAHPDADFTLVRGARAYAVLPRSGDTTRMELFSASGSRCGSLKFPSGGLTTGADGSVISAGGSDGCTKTVWPGLLR
jgi:hypothetical protein